MGLSVACALAADPIQITVQPVFENYSPYNKVAPREVLITNIGPNAVGSLYVQGTDSTTQYPVELPKGSLKRIVTYEKVEYLGTVYRLATDRGTYLKKIEPENTGYYTDSPNMVALVGDERSFRWLTTRNPNSGYEPNAFGGTSTRPETAPDRALGYKGFRAVVLGQGSERLSDDQVRALKLYTLSGGTLVFPGGASPSALRDPRWREILPAGNLHPVTVEGSAEIGRLGESPMQERITLTVGTPVAGAQVRRDQRHPITTEKAVGLGRVLLLAFDPSEAPLDDYAGLPKILPKLLKPELMSPTRELLTAYRAQDSVENPTEVQNDPFSIQLPPGSRIFSILVLYVVVVAPINFLLLRRLGRGELAWLTAPAISLGFAMVMFQFAKSLYSAQMSTATQGLLVLHEGVDEGVFLGATQMFIPRSGTYDLKLNDVDSLGAPGVEADPMYRYYGEPDQSRVDLLPVDTGEIQVPRMRAANLAFKEVSYTQAVETKGWFTVKRLGSDKYQVTNRSPYLLKDARIYAGTSNSYPQDLAAGETKVFVAAGKNQPNAYGQKDVRKLVERAKAAALGGRIQGLRPGPQIGTEVSQRTQIDLFYVLREGRS